MHEIILEDGHGPGVKQQRRLNPIIILESNEVNAFYENYIRIRTHIVQILNPPNVQELVN